MKKTCRRKRILAFLIDIMILYGTCLLSVGILRLAFLGKLAVILFAAVAMPAFACFLFRDYLFFGRSLGKRMLKLCVVDGQTLDLPTAKQLIVKGLGCFLNGIDVVFLLATGKSLGERISSTVVVGEEALPPSATTSKPPLKKRFVKLAVISACVGLAFSFVTFLALESVKQGEDYQMAYAYLLESDAVREMNAPESQIILTGYSSGERMNDDCQDTSRVVAFTFLVQGRQFRVVCHGQGDQLTVCPVCTQFQ